MPFHSSIASTVLACVVNSPGLAETLNCLLMGMSGFYFAYNMRVSSTAASRLVLRLSTGGRGQKLLPTVVAAKVDRLSIAFGVESGCFVHGHAADGVFGHGFRFIHGHVPFLLLLLSFDSDFSGVWKTRGRGVASRCGQVAPLTPARDEHRHACPVSAIFITELFHHFALLTSR